LIYLRAREYDPATGQFLSVDPLATITRAPYTYVHDNSLNGSDRSGLIGGFFEEELSVPCIWPCAPSASGAKESIEGAIHASEQGIENAWNAINEHEGYNDEGEQSLKEHEASQKECEIPRGAINAKAAIKKLREKQKYPKAI
jgi:uncharacterized protein RhaS with RHS repeats